MSGSLQINNLTVTRNGKSLCDVPELSVEPGEIINIQGLNGSGKSTLFRVIAGLEKSYSGNVSIPANFQPVGFVQQNPYLFRGTVLNNLLYGTRARHIPNASELAHDLAKQLNIHNLLDRRVRHLSGGERRRVALARTMILAPPLLLLDEPFAEMDSKGIEATCHYLNSLEGTTILIASPTPLPDCGLQARVITVS